MYLCLNNEFEIRCYGIKEAALSKGGLCLKSFFLSQVDF